MGILFRGRQRDSFKNLNQGFDFIKGRQLSEMCEQTRKANPNSKTWVI